MRENEKVRERAWKGKSTPVCLKRVWMHFTLTAVTHSSPSLELSPQKGLISNT